MHFRSRRLSIPYHWIRDTLINIETGLHDFSRSRQLKVSHFKACLFFVAIAETRFPELLSLLDKLVFLPERSDRTTGLYRVGPFVGCLSNYAFFNTDLSVAYRITFCCQMMVLPTPFSERNISWNNNLRTYFSCFFTIVYCRSFTVFHWTNTMVSSLFYMYVSWFIYF